MKRKPKCITIYRAEIGIYDKKDPNYYRYKVVEMNKEGLPLHETEYQPNGKIQSEIHTTYNDAGKITEKATFYRLEGTSERVEISYNGAGFEEEEVQYYDDELYERLMYTRNDKGEVLKQERFDSEGMLIERYEAVMEMIHITGDAPVEEEREEDEDEVYGDNETEEETEEGTEEDMTAEADAEEEQAAPAEEEPASAAPAPVEPHDEERIVKQYFYNVEGELEKEVSLSYDTNGNCIREEHYTPAEDKTEITSYKYNSMGKKTVSEVTDADGETVILVKVKYDKKGNPVRYESESFGFNHARQVNQITYDDEGRVIENEEYDIIGGYLMSKESLSYNEDGQLYEQESFELNNGNAKKTHYRLQLQYDYYPEEEE